MGWQFIPRIGQEVLVDFMDGVAERPVVVAALYNGQGELPGQSDTPEQSQASRQTPSSRHHHRPNDHRPQTQGNLIGSGHSPAWHGAGGSTQHHAGALNGIKSKAFGAWGFNQLVLDDSANQMRVQLATTQYATQLNMGHLIHQADNHRGSARGTGFELRTDAYGAWRAASGVLLTTYGQAGVGNVPTGSATAAPAGDNAAGIALAAQLAQLGKHLNQAAVTHQTTPLGAQTQLKAQLKDQLSAWHTSLKGMVNATSLEAAQSDAVNKNTATQSTNIPASADPLIALQARAGWATTAGQDIHWSAADHITLASGQNTSWASGGAYRLHTGQSIGLLAGAAGTMGSAGNSSAQEGKPAEGAPPAAGTGITLVAAQGDTHLQAQSNALQIAAQKQLSIQSETAHIDWAAAKKITLATAGGASIVIEGGNITVMCPGTLTVQASGKKFSGPSSMAYEMNGWAKTTFDDAYVLRNPSTGEPLANRTVEIVRGDGSRIKVKTDASGKTPIQKSQFIEAVKIRVLD